MREARGFGRGVSFFVGAWLLFALVAELPLAKAAEATVAWPLSQDARVVLAFGASYFAFDGAATHRGVDLAAAAGDDVLAPLAGAVRFVGRVPASAGGTQLAITITTSGGETLTFMPLADACVSAGDAVSTGERIASIAAAGDASSPAPHLHVGAKRGELYIDPMTLLASPGAAAGEPPTVEAPVPVETPVPAANVAATAADAAATARVAGAPSGAPVAAPAVNAAPAAIAPRTSPAPVPAAPAPAPFAGFLPSAAFDGVAALRAARAPQAAGTPVAGGATIRLPSAATMARAVRRTARAWTLGLFGALASAGALWPLWRRKDNPHDQQEVELGSCIAPEGT